MHLIIDHHLGSFVYYQPSDEQFLMINPTYYRLCQISLAYTLNMTSLEITTQNGSSNTLSTTADKPLIEWTITNISISSDNYTMTSIQSFPLRFFGSIADDFSLSGESDLAGGSDNATSDEAMSNEMVYIAVDDIILTYCLPCNFDILNESGA